ncbi:MAG: Glycosyl transferase family 2 [Candidatus Levybacteria bacterium GW2011_GWC2_37_7]|nr:MAG: Glycosyl transferase family 2 [Candidatus Levybacteria bacterium GW2011_GWC2_37_7]
MFTMLFLSKYGKRPLHFFGIVGGIFFFFGILILIYLSIIHFQGHAIGRRPLLFLGMLLIIAGLQVWFTGFLADLIINISHKKNKEFFLKYSTEEA